MDDARRKFNVENKATVIMCFNVPKKELATLNFQLSGMHVAFVDEFTFIGHHDQQRTEPSWYEDVPPAHAVAVTYDATMRLVEALLGPFYTTLHVCMRTADN
jgi:hypothetical protein